ncbi:hypothetical protein CDD81_5866 [Ophiocordyceps australis]|uniref:Uncharacterized protein n=1 Tax=Ophiocordyceps australis TaxID=1399860 RepID=A0A2C5YIC5_9HYPO|nr:hypothetical protein CDD81_5866 [Ophiocordyceps australis]
MRYQDWDVLLFPRDCKVPFKEFRVACHVVPDAESKLPQLQLGLPTVCCFIPSLQSGAPFQVSIHSWSAPAVNQATRCYSEYSHSAQFEARLFIDGRLVASSLLGLDGDWPHVIAHGFNMWRNGNFEALKFPEFRQELLQQSHWSPADAFGRIKVLISEAFPRDSMTMPTERIKNVVAFSFQHAPLDILEMSSIAWPNPAMWRRTPLVSSMNMPSTHADEADLHAHSPRRRPVSMQGNVTSMGTPFMQDMAYRSALAAGARHASQPASGTTAGFNVADSFGDATAYLDWLGSMDASLGAALRSGNQENTHHDNARRSNTDVSMPDYVSMSLGDQVALPPEPPNAGPVRHEDEIESGASELKVPTNTPTTGGQGKLDAQDGSRFGASPLCLGLAVGATGTAVLALTPGSTRGLDDEDEPRRATSRATCSPLVNAAEERK